MATVDRLAPHILGPLAPDGEDVVPLLQLRALAPEAANLAPPAIGFVVLAIDAGGGPVVLADGVDRGLAKAVLVIGVGLRRKIRGQAAVRLAAAEKEVFGLRRDQALRERRRLGEKIPVPIAQAKRLVGP